MTYGRQRWPTLLAVLTLLAGACSSDRAEPRTALAQATFPLPAGRELIAATQPNASRLLVRQLAAELVDLPGVEAVEADYEAAAVRVLLTPEADPPVINRLRERLSTSPAIVSIR